LVRDKAPACINNGTMIIGSGVAIRGFDKKVRLFTFPSATLVIGDRTFINSGAQIFSFKAVHIGDDCLIGDNCAIFDTNFHGVHEGETALVRPIVIGRNVWLGRNVTVLPGVSIGDHSVVGTGSVVTESIPARQVWQGNPARYVKDVRASDGFRRRA
jgi:acetyltransferase-like isoleucine patch superfamily enzyme